MTTSPDNRRLLFSVEEAGERLDKALAARLDDLSRARIQALIEAGAVTVAGQPVRSSHRISEGDEVLVTVPASEPAGIFPEAIPLDVTYEDADLLVVNKPAGLVVHPAPGHASGTLANALLAHCPDLIGVGGTLRPGIVHRLDKETSGLLVVAKHDRAHRFLAAQLKERRMDKRYLTLVDGRPTADSGTIEAPIGRDPRYPRQMAAVAGGRPAATHFRVLQRYAKHAYLECKPVTGRTHQIRVHLASIGCPVVADKIYGHHQSGVTLTRHFLHAARLTFQLLGGSTRTFEAPLPADLEAALTRIA